MEQKEYNEKFNKNLEKWLEGHDDIDEDWIDYVSSLKDKSPKYLYRTILTEKDYELNEKICIKVKKIFSASDTCLSSLYAACSYNSDMNKDIKDNTRLITIRFKVHNCCMSLYTLRTMMCWRADLLKRKYLDKIKNIKETKSKIKKRLMKIQDDYEHMIGRINTEREYICSNDNFELQGVVVLKTDNVNMLKNKEYLKYETSDSISSTILDRDDVHYNELVRLIYFQ